MVDAEWNPSGLLLSGVMSFNVLLFLRAEPYLLPDKSDLFITSDINKSWLAVRYFICSFKIEA